MIKYKKINIQNIELATKIQMQIFPKESAYQEFLDCINSNKEYNCYYLVYDDDIIVGITGLYTTTNIMEDNTIWMGWFGILEKYRKKGYGRKVLLDTINIAKEMSLHYPIKYFRVFTSTTENPDVLNLYKKNMDIVENYNNKNDYNYNNSCVIYTKILGDYPIKKWNNKFININEMIEKEKVGNKKFGSDTK